MSSTWILIGVAAVMLFVIGGIAVTAGADRFFVVIDFQVILGSVHTDFLICFVLGFEDHIVEVDSHGFCRGKEYGHRPIHLIGHFFEWSFLQHNCGFKMSGGRKVDHEAVQLFPP